MTAEEAMRGAQALRNMGYAVIIWTPEELRGAKAHQVEGRSIELGYQIIEDLCWEGDGDD